MSAPRAPRFLGVIEGGGAVRPAPFDRHDDDSRTRAQPVLSLLENPPLMEVRPPPRPPPPPPPAPAPQADQPQDRNQAADQGGKQTGAAARYVAAIDTLRHQTEKLAEQARADAVEIAFQVARKLLESELATNSEPLFSLVRAAVQKLGDARHITIRVSPGDLVMLKGDRGQSEISSLRLAQVDLVGDPILQAGDCVIESPNGAVDGRLSVRLAELRKAVEEALEGAA